MSHRSRTQCVPTYVDQTDGSGMRASARGLFLTLKKGGFFFYIMSKMHSWNTRDAVCAVPFVASANDCETFCVGHCSSITIFGFFFFSFNFVVFFLFFEFSHFFL